jgi:hypothetical protein
VAGVAKLNPLLEADIAAWIPSLPVSMAFGTPGRIDLVQVQEQHQSGNDGKIG